MTELLQHEKNLSQSISKLVGLQWSVIGDSKYAYAVLLHAQDYLHKQHVAVTAQLGAYFAEEVIA